jgi:hypothetical protein
MKLNELKAKAQTALHQAKTKLKDIDLNMDTAKTYGNQALKYAKENPSDIMVGLITIMVMDMDDSIESIEDSTAISAIVDADSYINHRY